MYLFTATLIDSCIFLLQILILCSSTSLITIRFLANVQFTGFVPVYAVYTFCSSSGCVLEFQSKTKFPHDDTKKCQVQKNKCIYCILFIFFLIKQVDFRRLVWLGTDPRGGWCPSRCCFGSPPCTRTWTRPGCRAPPRWTAACCTSRTWNSWGETLCSWPCAPGRWAGSPGRSRHTWCQTSCWRTQNCCVSLPV